MSEGLALSKEEMARIISNVMLDDRPLSSRNDLVIMIEFLDNRSDNLSSNPLDHIDMRETYGKVMPSGKRAEYIRSWDIGRGVDELMLVRIDHHPTREEAAAVRLVLLLLQQKEDSGWAHDVARQEIGRLLRSFRKQLGLTLLDVGSYLGLGTSEFDAAENGKTLMARRTLVDWCEILGVLGRPQRPLVRAVGLGEHILRLLKKDPTEMRNLTPGQMQELVGDRLEKMGYSVQTTGSVYAPDGGIDMIAVSKVNSVPHMIACQVKHHRGEAKTRRADVEPLLQWRDKFQIGLLVTNTTFTTHAYWLAKQHQAFLRLRGLLDLKRWLEDEFEDEEEYRELPTSVELGPGLVVPVPRPKLSH